MRKHSLPSIIVLCMTAVFLAGCMPPDLTNTLTIDKPAHVAIFIAPYSSDGQTEVGWWGEYEQCNELTHCEIELPINLHVRLSAVWPNNGDTTEDDWHFEYGGACTNKEFCFLSMLLPRTVSINEVDCPKVAASGELIHCLGASPFDERVYDDQGNLRSWYDLENFSVFWPQGVNGLLDAGNDELFPSATSMAIANLIPGLPYCGDAHRINTPNTGFDLQATHDMADQLFGEAALAPARIDWLLEASSVIVDLAAAWQTSQRDDFVTDSLNRETLPNYLRIASDTVNNESGFTALVEHLPGRVLVSSLPEFSPELEFSFEYIPAPFILNARLNALYVLNTYSVTILSTGEHVSFDGTQYHLVAPSGIERICYFNHFEPGNEDHGFLSDIEELGCQIMSP